MGERLGSEVVRIENQGDRVCPYYLKSMWRYADGDLNALVYDVTLRIACMDGNITYSFIRSNVRRQNVISKIFTTAFMNFKCSNIFYVS